MVILITGAAHGIGRASAEALLAQGHTVYGGDIDFDAMHGITGDAFHPVRMDVTSDESVAAAVARVVAEQGRIDGLHSNAGYTCMGLIETVDLDEAKRNFEVNLWGAARCVKAVLPHMRAAAPQGRGRMVITTSATGIVPLPGISWYPATKHALEAFGDGLRMEMEACFPGIKVTMIEPGWIRTHLLKASLPTLDRACESEYADVYREQLDNLRANFSKGINTGADPETIAEVVVEAFAAESPPQRYCVGFKAKAGVIAAKFFAGKVLDEITIKQFLGTPEA